MPAITAATLLCCTRYCINPWRRIVVSATGFAICFIRTSVSLATLVVPVTVWAPMDDAVIMKVKNKSIFFIRWCSEFDSTKQYQLLILKNFIRPTGLYFRQTSINCNGAAFRRKFWPFRLFYWTFRRNLPYLHVK